VPRISPEGVESDVQNERDRVKAMREGSEENDAIVIDELTKVYHSKKKSFVAVKGVSVGVPRGECFGLLEENNATRIAGPTKLHRIKIKPTMVAISVFMQSALESVQVF
ncbi:hypothetical protein SARC_17607, partial [Sphaeroforma arctica JP610]